MKHALRKEGPAKVESLRQIFTLQRGKHNRIHTHWSQYSRGWGESDLWDSWFRMLALARIQCFLSHHSEIEQWGFINYPGIGFYSRRFIQS